MSEVYTSTFGTNTSGRKGKDPLIPEPGYEEIADAIQRRLSQEPILKSYGMRLAPKCNRTYTVVSQYMLNCCTELSRRTVTYGIDAELDIMNIITMTRSGRYGGTEKRGNLDPVFYAGERGLRLINGDKPFFDNGEQLLPLDEDGKPDVTSPEYQTALAIQTVTAKDLISYDIFMKATDFSIYVLTAMYLKCMIEEVRDRALNSKSGKCTFVLYTVLSVEIASSRDGITLSFFPGEDAKKIIKSDAHTENR